MSDIELVVVEDAQEVAAVIAERLARAAGEGGNVVLTGGKTPEEAYREAARRAPDWSRVDVWWGDERCVPPEDENSNFGMAKRSLLDRLERPPRGVHRIKGELGKAEAAAEYERELDATGLDALPERTDATPPQEGPAGRARLRTVRRPGHAQPAGAARRARDPLPTRG